MSTEQPADREPQLLASLQAWVKALDRLDYYALLGLQRGAGAGEIKLAFHRFALAFHPDRYRDFAPELEQLSQRVFVRGVEAYKVLRDPRTRSDYDVRRAGGQLRAGKREPMQQPLPVMGRPAPTARPQSLVDLCRSPAARLCAMNADRQISEGDLRGARKLLLEAISKDGGNPQLQARLDALDFALDAMG